MGKEKGRRGSEKRVEGKGWEVEKGAKEVRI